VLVLLLCLYHSNNDFNILTDISMVNCVHFMFLAAVLVFLWLVPTTDAHFAPESASTSLHHMYHVRLLDVLLLLVNYFQLKPSLFNLRLQLCYSLDGTNLPVC